MTVQTIVQPPIEPMLARLVSEIPAGPGWHYEPKWDGFRALVFFDGDETYLICHQGALVASTSRETYDRV